jgi:hypothetical protein
MVKSNRRDRRAATRRNRRNSRKNRSTRSRRNNFVGGYAANNASPQEINDTSMMSPQRLSVGQGNQFAELTKNMHGGMGVYPGAVTDSGLPQNLHASARLLALDQKYAEIANMRDQAGGRRHRKSRKGRKASRKTRKGRKGRKASRKGRKTSRKGRRSLRGGALGYASTDAPGMLLDASQTARAGLNPEWKLAEDPNSFAPQ